MARLAITPAASTAAPHAAAPRSARRPGAAAWSVPLALVAALVAVTACRAREGERCVCAEDCRDGLLCVASGRVLAEGECSPAVGQESPGVCLSEEEAAEDDGGGGPVEPFMDLGSKLDFEPGPPEDPETESGTGATEGTGATTEATGTTAEATGSSGSTGGTTEATGSSGGTTDATGSSGGTTEATGSSSSGSSSST
jgi:cobalamin biosynthesis Mg chelatase CobN